MSYTTAKRNFKENRDAIDAGTDPLGWNLYNGLYQLALAQETELTQMRETLARILSAVQQ